MRRPFWQGGAVAARKVRAWRFWRLVPVTPLGGLVLTLGALATWGPGRGAGDLILLTAGTGAMAVVALSSVVAILRSLVLVRDLRSAGSADRIRGECDRPIRTGFRLPTRPLLAAARVTWRWDEPDAVVREVQEGGWVEEEITPQRRALGHAVRRRFAVEDLFGLARIELLHDEERFVRFIPSRGGLRDVDLVRGLAGGDALGHPDGSPDGDRIDLRPYAMGDPVRFVLWKVYARNRELVVRTPERALSPVDRTVAYVVSGRSDEPAAGAARVAVEGGRLGRDWLLGADGGGRPATLSDEAMDLLARSAGAGEADGGLGLPDFLAQAAVGGASRAVVFVPAVPGPWLDRVTHATAHGRTDVDFLVCVDGVRFGVDEKPAAWWRAEEAEVGIAAEQLRETLRRLSGTRRRVTVVDRRSGRVVDAATLLRGEA